MATRYKMHVPNIEDFNMEYYFHFEKNQVAAKVFPPHVHNTLEFYVLLDGDASFMVEHKLYKLEHGDIIMSRPNEMHNCILNSLSTHAHLCMYFTPTCELVFSPFLSGNFGENNLISPSKEEKTRLYTLYRQLHEATEKSDVRRRFYLTLEILDIFSHNVCKTTTAQILPPVLRDILNDVNKNFRQIHSLAYFTEKYYISASTLSRLFKTYLHTSPKNYLDTKRLACSRTLLKSGYSVTEAAKNAGFPDCSNYIRLFKRTFGVTPRYYQEH